MQMMMEDRPFLQHSLNFDGSSLSVEFCFQIYDDFGVDMMADRPQQEEVLLRYLPTEIGGIGSILVTSSHGSVEFLLDTLQEVRLGRQAPEFSEASQSREEFCFSLVNEEYIAFMIGSMLISFAHLASVLLARYFLLRVARRKI